MTAPILAFLAGAGAGYLNQSEREQQKARQKQRDDQDAEEFKWKKDDRQRQDSLNGALASAGEQAVVKENVPTLNMGDGTAPKVYDMPNGIDAASVVGSDARQARSMAERFGSPAPAAEIGATNSVRGVGYGNKIMALNAASDYNAPGAVLGRQSMAYQQAGKPMEALRLQEEQSRLQKSAREYEAEGYSDALKSLSAGDGVAAAAAFNRSGKSKIVGDIAMTPVDRELPGIGKIKTYDARFKMVGPDGQEREMSINSHDARMASMPYEKQMELHRKGSDSEARATNLVAKLENSAKALEISGNLAEARIQLAQAQAVKAASGGGAGGTGTRAERVQARSILTGLQSNMSAELRDIDAQVKAAMPQFQPKGAALPTAVQDLQARRAEIEARKKEVDSAMVDLLTEVRPNLAESVGTRTAAPAREPATAAKPAAGGPAAKASLNVLPAGAKQIGTSGGKPVYETADGKRFQQQ